MNSACPVRREGEQSLSLPLSGRLDGCSGLDLSTTGPPKPLAKEEATAKEETLAKLGEAFLKIGGRFSARFFLKPARLGEPG